LQSVDAVGDEYIEPTAPGEPGIELKEGPGVLWLVSLARGSLGT
jgi:hypothetical protein